MGPTPYKVGNHGLATPMRKQDLDHDARGIAWIWEPPSPAQTYCMGIDPTVGITGWHRELRTSDDHKVDNGAIEIIRLGRRGQPDVQVCEYAAPLDPEELADVANLLGRIFAGNSDDGQCLSIIEVYPGPGLLTLRRMIEKWGYTNQWAWQYLNYMVAHRTITLGWQASQKSVRDLWIRGKRHISLNKLKILSPWLREEMADAEYDAIRMNASAVVGRHDDRLRAMLLALWAGHEWSMDVETEKVEVNEAVKAPDWQKSSISYEAMMEAWEERFAQIMEE